MSLLFPVLGCQSPCKFVIHPSSYLKEFISTFVSLPLYDDAIHVYSNLMAGYTSWYCYASPAYHTQICMMGFGSSLPIQSASYPMALYFRNLSVQSWNLHKFFLSTYHLLFFIHISTSPYYIQELGIVIKIASFLSNSYNIIIHNCCVAFQCHIQSSYFSNLGCNSVCSMQNDDANQHVRVAIW